MKGRQVSRPFPGANSGYQLLGELNGNTARVRFSGRFEGRQVCWDCEFVTLQFEYQRLANSNCAGEQQPLRSFIQIEVLATDLASLRVGLNIPLIDAPAIEKMVLMIRNYKRLGVGRHEFGEVYLPL